MDVPYVVKAENHGYANLFKFIAPNPKLLEMILDSLSF